MIYDAKIFNTYDPSSPQIELNQTHNEEWSRYIGLHKVGWKPITCSGQSYLLPDLGQPLPPGQAQPLPSGDPGPTAKASPFRIEAESMLSFGTVMGPTIQSLASDGGDTMVLAITCSTCSSGYMQTHLPELAADAGGNPKTSGLVFGNCPPASGLTVAHANSSAGSLDLWIGGTFAQTLQLPASQDGSTFRTDTFKQQIGVGDELKRIGYSNAHLRPTDQQPPPF